jgi:peptide/nickel transport system substrate-binding protein
LAPQGRRVWAVVGRAAWGAYPAAYWLAYLLVALALILSGGCRDSKGRRAKAGKPKTDAQTEQRAGAEGEGIADRVPPCRAPESPAPRAFGGSLKVLLEQEPPHLDPLDDPPQVTLDVLGGLIYEPLVECGDGRIHASLAERWEWTSDRTRLVLQLRSGVRWHDGKALTAADVQASLEAFLRGRSRQSVPAAALAEVTAVEMGPEGAIRLRVARPGAGILHALCDVPIVPAAFARSARGKAGALRERPVGTGPWQLTAWERGRQIRLTRNPFAWRGAAAPEEIVLEIEVDPWRALVRARSGEVDLATVPSGHYPDQVRRAARSAQVELRRVPGERFSFLAVNHRGPVLADVAVRRALSLLWNRAALSAEVHHGLVVPIAAPLGSVAAAPFDPKVAARTLTEAGWRDENGDGIRERGGVPLRLDLGHAAAAGGSFDIELRRFSTNLQRAGVRLEVAQVEPAALLQKVRAGDFDLVPLTWRGRKGEDPASLLGQGGRFNHGGFRSPRVQALLDELRAAETDELRDGVIPRLAQAIAEELPAIFLYRHDSVVLVTRRVRGLCSESGRLDLRGVWLEPPA